MSAEFGEIKNEAESKMEGALHHLDHDFNTIRTGRANPAILDTVKVDAYGTEMPINQVANISTPDGRTIMITPWDKGQLSAIERAIMMANLGFNPNNDGINIRINIPPLTEERRKEMVKLAAKMAEDARVAIRHVRKHSNDSIKKLEKDHVISEDQGRDYHDQIQKITDDYIKKVDESLAKKDKEVMSV